MDLDSFNLLVRAHSYKFLPYGALEAERKIMNDLCITFDKDCILYAF